MKTIEVEIDTSCGLTGIPSKLKTLLPHPPSWAADERLAFSMVAIATAPPSYVGFTLADTWAHQRYFAAVDPVATELRLRSEWDDLDPHQKTILADDWGVGFPLLYLQQKLDLFDIVGTDAWLKYLEKIVGKINIPKKKNGPPKLPDYIAIDSALRLHAFECKGTQTSRAHLSKQIKSGVLQVSNLKSTGALPSKMHSRFDSWLVAGLYVPTSKAKAQPLLLIADPDYSELAKAIERVGDEEKVLGTIRAVSLCQQLSAIGLPRLATTLFNRFTSPEEAKFLHFESGHNRETRFMGFEQVAGDMQATRYARVFDHTESNRGAPGRLISITYSIPTSLLISLSALIDKLGRLDSGGLDALLAGRTSSTASQDDQFRPGGPEAGHPKPWQTASKDVTSSLRTQYGIKFEVSETAFEG